MQRTRSNSWHSSVTAISATVSSISTDDPLVSVVTVPAGTLHLVFGGKADGTITLASALAHRHDPVIETPARPVAVDREKEAREHPNRIELSIDSLPNHELIEPIPVLIDPAGDDAFTAWVRNLDTNATGQSVFEALLLLKERIAAVYDELNQRSQLTAEQRTTLQMLHTYIAPPQPKKPERG